MVSRPNILLTVKFQLRGLSPETTYSKFVIRLELQTLREYGSIYLTWVKQRGILVLKKRLWNILHIPRNDITYFVENDVPIQLVYQFSDCSPYGDPAIPLSIRFENDIR